MARFLGWLLIVAGAACIAVMAGVLLLGEVSGAADVRRLEIAQAQAQAAQAAAQAEQARAAAQIAQAQAGQVAVVGLSAALIGLFAVVGLVVCLALVLAFLVMVGRRPAAASGEYGGGWLPTAPAERPPGAVLLPAGGRLALPAQAADPPAWLDRLPAGRVQYIE